MTAEQFLKDKGWYAGSLMLSKTKGQGLVSITEAMEEYHQAKLKLLGIANVSNCTLCNTEINYKGVCEMCYTEQKLNDLD